MAKTVSVSPTRLPRVILLGLAAALTVSGCTRGTEASVPAKVSPAPAPPSRPAPAPKPASASLDDIPGMDFSSLPAPARRELATILSDEFCYCGCPHTLGQCLRAHGACPHGRRMAQLAARQVAAGTSSTEVILNLSQYYGSFREPRVKQLQVDERQCMGDAKAPVTLVEFSDFECPYCRHARPILEAFAKKNAQRVRFCSAPFPLPMHANAFSAGQAVLWARDQGKFWEMHDALFEHQEDLSAPVLESIAQGLGLPVAGLRNVLKEGAYVKELERSRDMGRAAQVHGTPTLFINGRSHALGFNEDDLSRSVEDELEWSTHGNAWAAD